MKKRLGNVPKGLEWIHQGNDDAATLNAAVKIENEPLEGAYKTETDVTRATFIMSKNYIDKIKAYAYWERIQIKDVMEQMCEEFFAGRKIRSIPTNKKNS